jgi:hypothetical protein
MADENRKRSSARPGQVRFEAWVPMGLLLAFRRVVPASSRKAWLVRQMEEEVRRAEPEQG